MIGTKPVAKYSSQDNSWCSIGCKLTPMQDIVLWLNVGNEKLGTTLMSSSSAKNSSCTNDVSKALRNAPPPGIARHHGKRTSNGENSTIGRIETGGSMLQLCYWQSCSHRMYHNRVWAGTVRPHTATTKWNGHLSHSTDLSGNTSIRERLLRANRNMTLLTLSYTASSILCLGNHGW